MNEILNKLNSVAPIGEGSTYSWSPHEEDDKQKTLGFLRQYLTDGKFNTILETGTHKGHFCFFCKQVLPNVKIFTFGIDNFSINATEILNTEFGKYIWFTLGDSKHTLTTFQPDEKIDLAWIDGGHDYNTAYHDLLNCHRLRIPAILIDDCSLIRDVNSAVSDFLKLGYHISGKFKSSRGIVELKLND